MRTSPGYLPVLNAVRQKFTADIRMKKKLINNNYPNWKNRQLIKLDHIIKGQDNTTQHNTGKDKDEVDR